MKKYYFTKKGLKKLQDEIEALTKKLTGLQAQTAHVAEVGGDQYHDNSSYEMLVIDIRGIDHRISMAYQCLNRAVVVETPTSVEKVAIGTLVTILRDGGEVTWEIAGFGESDPVRKIIAYNTPLAAMLIGRRKGDIVEGIVAGKQAEIEILNIILGGENENQK
jgi:transcription elongation factor GreA